MKKVMRRGNRPIFKVRCFLIIQNPANAGMGI